MTLFDTKKDLLGSNECQAIQDQYLLVREREENGRFCPNRPALPHIKGLDGTKTHDKTFAVLGGFWHSAA
jgi:hypothetical protein